MCKDTIDISGLDKADVLRLLYNNARTQGMGVVHFTPEDMTRAEALDILDEGPPYFDYLKGRVMKVSLDGDSLRTALYDRDNGPGAALDALAPLLENR